LIVEQLSNPPNQQHFVVLIVAAVSPSLYGLQLREFLFPVPEDMRLYTAQLAHFADREVALRRNKRKRGHGTTVAVHPLGSAYRLMPSASAMRER